MNHHVCIACLFTLFVHGAARGEDAQVEGDLDLLRTLRDAQAAAKSNYARGRLAVEVDEMWTVGIHSKATIRAEWDPRGIYWVADYRRESVDPEADIDVFDLSQHVSDEDIRVDEGVLTRIERSDYTCTYELGRVSIQRPPREDGFHIFLKFKPQQIWLSYACSSRLPWSKIFDPSSSQGPVTMKVHRNGDNGIELFKDWGSGELTRVEASLAKAGLVERYEYTPRPQPGRPTFEVGTFDWEQLSSGTWVVSEMKQEHYFPDRNGKLVYSYRIKLLEYDDAPDIADDRFEIQSLDLPVGTRVFESTGEYPQVTRRMSRIGNDGQLHEIPRPNR